MSRRIAHRPRYQSMKHLTHPRFSPRSTFFAARQRWAYRRQQPIYQRHTPGYSLSLLPRMKALDLLGLLTSPRSMSKVN